VTLIFNDVLNYAFHTSHPPNRPSFFLCLILLHTQPLLSIHAASPIRRLRDLFILVLAHHHILHLLLVLLDEVSVLESTQNRQQLGCEQIGGNNNCCADQQNRRDELVVGGLNNSRNIASLDHFTGQLDLRVYKAVSLLLSFR